MRRLALSNIIYITNIAAAKLGPVSASKSKRILQVQSDDVYADYAYEDYAEEVECVL